MDKFRNTLVVVPARGGSKRIPNKNIKSKSYEVWIKYAALRDAAILELLYSTGMRINELVNLTEDNIDLISGTVIVKGKGKKENGRSYKKWRFGCNPWRDCRNSSICQGRHSHNSIIGKQI